MKAITFNLSGKTGFFKKPDVNISVYFTYTHIHKVALLGLLGAILGYGGYNQQAQEDQYPEFYEKLKDIKVSIKPCTETGYFTKKIQVFNNSVGYASKEDGGNLIVNEQWLENPEWKIYILCDKESLVDIYEKLGEALLTSQYVYIPYLGKNDHPATIRNAEIIELTIPEELEYISTVFPEELVELGSTPYDENQLTYFLREISPTSLHHKYNFYEFTKLCFTNLEIEQYKDLDIYEYNNENLAFF